MGTPFEKKLHHRCLFHNNMHIFGTVQDWAGTVMNVPVCVFLVWKTRNSGFISTHYILSRVCQVQEKDFLPTALIAYWNPKYQTAFVVWSLGLSISEVAGLCNYFGRHEDLEVQLCHPVVTNISESTSFRLLLSPGSLILGKKLTAAVQDIVIRPLLLSKVVEKLWSWNICHQHQQYPCYGSIFQPENKSCAKSKQQQFPCCVLSSNAVHSQY